MIVFIIITTIVIVALLFAIVNLLLKLEAAEDSFEHILSQNVKLIKNIEKTYDIVQQADVKGSFEADDEVGTAFKTMHDTIRDLKESI